MDEAAERRIERRLQATFGSDVPKAAFDERGLQTWGSFFDEGNERPASPYTWLFLEGGKKRGRSQESALGEEHGSEVNGRTEEEAGSKSETKGNGVQKGEGEEGGEDSGSESGSSSSSEGSSEGKESEGFRKRVEDNMAYRAKRMREEKKPG